MPPSTFFKKIFESRPHPSSTLIRTPPKHRHTHTCTHTHKHTHTHTHTNSRTHITCWFFIFFRKKIRKMKFKVPNEVRKQWLLFLNTLICIVLSQYACRLFVKLRNLNQIRQVSPSFLLILFWWIFQSQPLIKALGYWGPRSRVLVFWKLQNMSYLN